MKKVVSILLCYCILMLPTGCRSSKLLSKDEATTMGKGQKYLVLHTTKERFKIYNYKFTNDSIKGDLRKFSGNIKNTINVYTDFIFDIKLDNVSSQYIKLARSDIRKMTYVKFSAGNTILAVLGGVGIIAIIAVIVANSMTFDLGPIFSESQ